MRISELKGFLIEKPYQIKGGYMVIHGSRFVSTGGFGGPRTYIDVDYGNGIECDSPYFTTKHNDGMGAGGSDNLL